jgi:SAM-dependent methyltransferase
MKNTEQWHPTKFVYNHGKLRASQKAEDASPASRLIIDRIAHIYAHYLPMYAGGKLLDLGCGTVPLYAVYRPHVTEVTCVDWADGLHDRSHLDIEHDLTKPLPFIDDSFDTVILSNVLEHLPEPMTVMNEIGRILTPGGRLLLDVPFYYWLHEAPHDYYRYTEFALRRFVKLAGLEILVIEPLGGAPEIMADLFAKNVRRVPGGVALGLLAQWAAGKATATKLGYRISMATAETCPLGYFLVAKKNSY